MGFKDKFHIHSSGDNGGDQQQSSTKRRRSQFNLVTPDQVTEHSLQVWRALPAEIRHDPSMASFQMENDRLRGGSSEPTDNETRKEESSNEDDISCTGSEYISMKKLGKHDKAEKYLGEKSSDIDEQSSDHENLDDSSDKSKTRRNIERKIKKGCLMIFWLFTAGTLIVTREKELVVKTLSVPAQSEKLYTLPQNPLGDIKMKIFGAFNESVRMTPETENYLTLQLQLVHDFGPNGTESAQDILKPWLIPIVPDHEFDTAPLQTTNRTMELPRDVINKLDGGDAYKIRLKIYTNNATNDLTIRLIYDPLVVDVVTGTLLAALILSIFYALLVWEIFHRTFVAVICSMASIAILAVLGDRPTMDEIVYWMDMEMLTLLFAMMLLIGIMTETGIFDYIAVVAFEISGGKIWPMIYSLCIITCFISSFLDNMTTVLLMTPVAIRLCEVMSLDPVPVLMGIIVHSNIGGSLTPIGDPISIIICSNHFIAKSGVTFMEFVANTIPGVILTVLQSCIYMRLVFWDIKSLRPHEPKEIKELRREIKVWQRTAYSLSSFSKDVDLVRETLLKKVKILKHKLKKKLAGVGSNDVYVATLEDLKLKYPIKKKLQLIQSLVALAFIIICFFIQSVPSMRTLPLGWVALLGLIALLIVLNRDDMEHMLHHIEWTTLLFFAAMFVMMECVERLGLITWIGEVTEDIILMVDRKQRLPMAIFIILWISALASAILDSIPVTAMMVKVVVSLVAKESLGLPLEPLVWALAFGPCLGGNGTLYGASANVLSAGMAEQHGYKISFTRYLKVVFPMMLGQVTVITIYLMLSHIAFEWHLIN